MQFLTISIRKQGAAEADPQLREAEIERARKLYSEGRIRQLWHRADCPGACVLWEADDDSHMQALLSSLPFVQAGCVDVTVLSLRPYSGFGPNGHFPLGALHHEK